MQLFKLCMTETHTLQVLFAEGTPQGAVVCRKNCLALKGAVAQPLVPIAQSIAF